MNILYLEYTQHIGNLYLYIAVWKFNYQTVENPSHLYIQLNYNI